MAWKDPPRGGGGGGLPERRDDHDNRLDIHLYIHQDHQQPDPRIDQILTALTTIKQQETTIMSEVSDLSGEIDTLTTQVAASTTVVESAVTLIQGFSARLQEAIDAATAAGATPEQIAALVALGTSIDTSRDALAAAVEANTPAAP